MDVNSDIVVVIVVMYEGIDGRMYVFCILCDKNKLLKIRVLTLGNDIK